MVGCGIALLGSGALLAGGCAASAPPAAVAADGSIAAAPWKVDATASTLGFRTAYTGNTVEGRFDRWTAVVQFDPAVPAQARLSVDVDIASVHTGVEEQDGALLTGDWFAASMFPRARFEAEGFRALGGDRYETRGRLSLRGVEREVMLPMTIRIEGAQARLSGEVELDRSQFGVGQGAWSSAAAVPHAVQVRFDVRGSLANRAGQASLQSADTPTVPAVPAAAAAAATVVDDYQPTPAFASQTRAPAPARPSAYRVEVLATGLQQPWSLAFLPNGEMLVTERPGRIRRVSADGTLSGPIANVPAVKIVAANGLHDVLLDRDFARNRILYLTYFAPLENDSPPTVANWIEWLQRPAGEHATHPYGYERIARARLSDDGTRLEGLEVIAEGADRRLVYAPDGSLFALAAPPAGSGIPVDEEPQRLENTYGKVLRLNSDGSVPRDNPFVGRDGVHPAIYAYGLRDMEGAAIHPDTGELWVHEHGPRGGDELNVIRPGRNYGFPVISYGREYSGALINEGRTAQAGMEQPVYYWTPSIGPSGMTFYTGDLFPEWRGNLFLGAMPGKRLIRLVLDGERVVSEEPLLVELGKRIRDVRQGPDGALYVLTAEAQGELLRIVPAGRGAP